jgi:hypothetical protein
MVLIADGDFRGFHGVFEAILAPDAYGSRKRGNDSSTHFSNNHLSITSLYFNGGFKCRQFCSPKL